MTRRSKSPAKPHARKKAAREKTSRADYDIDKAWADGISDTLLKGCHPYQKDAVLDPARRYSMLVGRGGSKTTTFRVRAIRKLTSKARASVLYFAATRMRAKDLMWGPLKTLLQRLGFEKADVVYNETELKCTIVRTGSVYQLAGLKDVADADKWRGSTWDEVQFDECGSIKPDLLDYTIYQVIGPRVHVIGLGGTPGRDRRKIFYEATRPGSPKHIPYRDRDKYPERRGYSSHHWTLADVVKLPNAKRLYPELCRLWAEALIEKADEGWGDDHPIWLREYMAVWAADGTLRVFGDFAPHKDGKPWNIWDPFDTASGKELIEGVAGLKIAVAKLRESFPEFSEWRFVVPKDMGHKDPFACNVIGFSPHDPLRRKWQVMSYERMGLHSKPIAELLLGASQVDRFIKEGVFPDGQAVKYGGVFGVIGWPDGMVFDTDHAHITELSDVYGLKTTKADKKPEYKSGAIEIVNGEFHDGRFFVLAGSPMAEQLEQLQWKELDNGKLVEDPAQANHSTDTAVYGLQLIQTLYSSGTIAHDPKTPAAPAAYQDPMGLEPGISPEAESDESDMLLADMTWPDDDDDWAA